MLGNTFSPFSMTYEDSPGKSLGASLYARADRSQVQTEILAELEPFAKENATTRALIEKILSYDNRVSDIKEELAALLYSCRAQANALTDDDLLPEVEPDETQEEIYLPTFLEAQ